MAGVSPLETRISVHSECRLDRSDSVGSGHDGEFPYQAIIDGRRWEIRVNDFPAEPLYTLMIDGQEALDLEDWPTLWKRP
jgi:hypothetical protein